MEHDLISDLEPEKVARLIAITLDKERGETLTSDDSIGELLQMRLADIWRPDNGKAGAWPAAIRRLLWPRRSEARRSFGEIVLDRHSTLTVVKDIRESAKKQAAHARDEAEHAVMTTIYFAAIANRIAFHRQRITTYSYESLQSSFAKLRRKPWMTAELGRLFETAQQACGDKVQEVKQDSSQSPR